MLTYQTAMVSFSLGFSQSQTFDEVYITRPELPLVE